MSEHRISTVTVYEGVDIDLFHEQMITSLDPADGYVHLPRRAVGVHDEMLLSDRNTQYMLSEQECAELKKDSRVVDVMWGTLQQNNIVAGRFGYYEDSQLRPHQKTTSVGAQTTEVNWGLYSSNRREDPFAGVYQQSFLAKSATSGANVDIVIQDSGIDETHPEFLDPDTGTSRITRVNWLQYNSTPGTLPTSYYTVLVDGHGTHVAGIAAGTTTGWARKANIISQRLLISPDTAGLDPLLAFQLLRAWHQSKTNGRPTIVNMSWGYFQSYPIARDPNVGQVNAVHGIRVSSIDSEIAACQAAGIIFVGAAGNNSHKIDVVGGTDYNLSYSYSGSTYYYMRGSSPSAATGVLCVGSVDAVVAEQKATSSCTGPRIDVWAPGAGIVAPWATGITAPVGYVSVAYQDSTTYKIVRLSGTSMASPQVVGVLALWLEANPNARQAQANEWLKAISTKNRMTDPLPALYTNSLSLLNAPNRYLYNGQFPFVVLKNIAPAGFSIKNVYPYSLT